MGTHRRRGREERREERRGARAESTHDDGGDDKRKRGAIDGRREDVLCEAGAGDGFLSAQRLGQTKRTGGLAGRRRGVARARTRELSRALVEHGDREQRDDSSERGEDDAGDVAELHVRRIRRTARTHGGDSSRRRAIDRSARVLYNYSMLQK